MRHRSLALACTLALTLPVVACSSGTGESAGSSSGSANDAQTQLPPCPLDALAKASGPVEVVVWHTQQAKPLDTMQALVDKYNASQNKVKVRLESQGSSYDELQRKFNAAVPSKQLPGVLMVDDTFTQSMADSGVILPAQSCINADHYDLADFAQTAKDYYTIKGALWPGSANLANILLFYNRDHFRRAGLDPDKPPATLAEMRQDAEKIKAAGIVDKPVVHEFATWKTEFWLTGAHSSVVNNDNGRGGTTDKATLAGNPDALELFNWFKGMQDAGLLEAVPATAGQINHYLAMAQQQASMTVESSSAATSIEAFLGGTLNPSSVGGGERAQPDERERPRHRRRTVSCSQEPRQDADGWGGVVHHQHDAARGPGRGLGLLEVHEHPRDPGADVHRRFLPTLQHQGQRSARDEDRLHRDPVGPLAEDRQRPGPQHRPDVPGSVDRALRPVPERRARQHRPDDVQRQVARRRARQLTAGCRQGAGGVQP